ncbi:MAG TPA: YraN family protein [Bacteroidota bacterium]|nr:YraN family protein [Bacteroidota bacterium]
MSTVQSKSKGKAGEAEAEQYLRRQGFRILQKNYYYDRGEIDLVAEDGDVLVFVEVKARSSGSHGTAEESITPEKENFLKRTAEGYLLEHQIEQRRCRFDLVAVEWHASKPVIRHIRDMFA